MIHKRGFLASLAAMCMAPFAVKAKPAPALYHVESESDAIRVYRSFLEELAEQDGAVVFKCIKWEAEGLIHVTALGHYKTDGPCRAWNHTLSWDDPLTNKWKRAHD